LPEKRKGSGAFCPHKNEGLGKSTHDLRDFREEALGGLPEEKKRGMGEQEQPEGTKKALERFPALLCLTGISQEPQARIDPPAQFSPFLPSFAEFHFENPSFSSDCRRLKARDVPHYYLLLLYPACGGLAILIMCGCV
jgi:hypothetical protein